MNDLRFALRQLLKSPGFTAVAMLTLALGIGANTVVFTVARTVLFRPLGFEGADRLVWLRLESSTSGVIEERLSWRDMADLREGTRSFEDLGTFGVGSLTWERDDQAERCAVLRVTPNLIDLLRIRPVLGRKFSQEEATDAAPPVVMISHELWHQRFDGALDILGRTLRLDGKSHTIIGVLPAGLEFPLERAPTLGTGSLLTAGVKSFWLPLPEPTGSDLTSRAARMFLPVARLKSDATEASARAELTALSQRLALDHPETNRHWRFDLVSFRDQILGPTRNGIPVLALAVASVLLICCVNLANLLLARGVTRQRELAVRAALGAGRNRIVRTLLLESLLLAMLGGVLGILLAQGALAGIRGLASDHVPFIREASLDATALGFTAVLSLLTTLVFGLLPALRQSRVQPVDSLRGGTRVTGGPQVRTWQRGLMAAQITLVLVLLFAAGLLLESFRRLVGQDLGYQPRSVVTIDLESWGFDTNGDVCRMYRALRDRFASVPGVEAVGTVSSVPLTGKWTFDERAHVEGAFVPEAERPSLAATFVAFDYFPAMGIPLVEGRVFRDDELDDDGYGTSVVLNESAANLLFPGRSALGGRFTVGSNPDRWLEVIGVVKDTRDVRLEARPQPRFYWHYAFGGAQVVIRCSAPTRDLLPRLREIAQGMDVRVQVQDIREMSAIISGTLAERRFLMTLLSAYALIALGIAVVGIFGAVACQVAQRTDEFGIRLALGSSPAGLVRLVLLQSLWVAALGMAAGLLLSLGTGRLLASQVFELSPQDPWMLGAVTSLTLGAALLASALPALRASQVDPIRALRAE